MSHEGFALYIRKGIRCTIFRHVMPLDLQKLVESVEVARSIASDAASERVLSQASLTEPSTVT